MTVTRPSSGSSMSQEPGFTWRRSLPAGAGSPGLAIWTDRAQDSCTLRLRGRLCADTVRLLDTHVDLLGAQACDEVVLDLEGVDGMDQVGARLIVGLGHYVAGRGGRFRLDGAAQAIQSMIARAEVELAS